MSKYKNPNIEGRTLRSIRGDLSNYTNSPAEENHFVEKSPTIRKNLPPSDKGDEEFELFSTSSNKGSINNLLNALKKNNNHQTSEQKQTSDKYHQTNLQPFLKKRVYISGDQEAKKDISKKNSDDFGIDPSSGNKNKEFDWKANLDRILDDENTKINFTATRMSDNDFDSCLENPESNQEEAKGSKSLKEIRSKNSVTYAKKLSDNSRNKSPDFSGLESDNFIQEDESKNAGRGYSAYEDWRILDTIDQLLLNEGRTALASRTLWANLKDPSTGRKLLDDKRSSESMRERYKRHLSWLDDDAKDQLEAFAKKHGHSEMKNYFSVIKKVDGVKQLVAISKHPNFDSEQSSNTRFSNRTENRNVVDDFPVNTKKSSNNRLERGELEENFDEDDYPQQNFGKNNSRQAGNYTPDEEFDFDAEENSRTKKFFKPKSPPKPSSVEKSGKSLIAKMLQGQQGRDVIEDDIENFDEDIYPTFGNQKTTVTVKNFIEVSGDDEEIKTDSDIIVVEEPSKSKKRRREDMLMNQEQTQSQTPEDLILKKVRLTRDYDKKALCPSNVFHKRKPVDKEFVINQNLMIYVDLHSENREFIIEESVLLKGLKRLANEYQVDVEDLKEISKKTSNDLQDVEKYLQSKDAMILWTEEEDQDLLQNNQTALKYLRLLKGPDRIQKRIEYLQDQ